MGTTRDEPQFARQMPTQRYDTKHKVDQNGLERPQPSVTTNTNICTDWATPPNVKAHQVIDRQSEWARVILVQAHVLVIDWNHVGVIVVWAPASIAQFPET